MGTIRELKNLEGNEGEPLNYMADGSPAPIFSGIKEMEYKSKSLVFLQAQRGNVQYVVVHGFRASDNYTTKTGLSAVKVEMIDDENDREEIRKLLRDCSTGPINFWYPTLVL